MGLVIAMALQVAALFMAVMFGVGAERKDTDGIMVILPVLALFFAACAIFAARMS